MQISQKDERELFIIRNKDDLNMYGLVRGRTFSFFLQLEAQGN